MQKINKRMSIIRHFVIWHFAETNELMTNEPVSLQQGIPQLVLTEQIFD